MDILNFISWIKSGRIVNSVDPVKTLLPIGLKDNRRDDSYLAGAITVEDFITQVVANVPSNPQVIDLKVTNGTVVTGTTTNTISQTILIPANTFTTAGGMLEFMARYQKTGSSGNQSCNVYLNTTPVINVSASLVAAFALLNTNNFIQGIRTARINSNTLTVFTIFSAATNDYSVVNNVQQSVAFNPLIDNYLLFSIQLSNAADSSVVQMARATKYE